MLFTVSSQARFLTPTFVQYTGVTYNYTDPTPPALNAPGQQGSLADGTTARLREFRMWKPNNLSSVRGILFNFNAQDSDNRASVDYLGLRAWAAIHSFVLIGSKHLRRCEPLDETVSDTPTDGPDWRTITEALTSFASQSGSPEIVNAPFCCMGYSAGGQVAYGVAQAAPTRVIATCANKGAFYNQPKTAQQTIPTLFITGGADTAIRRSNIISRYKSQPNNTLTDRTRQPGARFAWAEEPNIAHIWGNSEALLLAFFSECVSLRYPSNLNAISGQPSLLSIAETDGWLADIETAAWSTGYPAIRASNGFVGTKEDYAWLPNERMAKLYRAFCGYRNDADANFAVNKKYVRMNTPNNGLSDNNATVYTYLGVTDIQLQVDPNVTDWTQLKLFNGGLEVASFPNKGSNTINHQAYFPTTERTHTLYAELTRPSGTSTSSLYSFVSCRLN